MTKKITAAARKQAIKWLELAQSNEYIRGYPYTNDAFDAVLAVLKAVEALNDPDTMWGEAAELLREGWTPNWNLEFRPGCQTPTYGVLTPKSEGKAPYVGDYQELDGIPQNDGPEPEDIYPELSDDSAMFVRDQMT